MFRGFQTTTMKMKFKKLFTKKKEMRGEGKGEEIKEVKVSGFSFVSQGWNSRYTRYDRNTIPNQNEAIIDILLDEADHYYYLKPYNMWGLIGIVGVFIFKYDKVWKMLKEVDTNRILNHRKGKGGFIDNPFVAYKLGEQTNPVGEWKVYFQNVLVQVSE